MEDAKKKEKYMCLLACIYTAKATNFGEKILEEQVSSVLLKAFMQDEAGFQLPYDYMVEQASNEISLRMYDSCNEFLEEAKLVLCGGDESEWEDLDLPEIRLTIPVEEIERIQDICESRKKQLVGAN